MGSDKSEESARSATTAALIDKHPLGTKIANSRLPRHGTFYVALGIGFVALLVGLWLDPDYAVLIAANITFAVYLGLVALMLPVLDADFLRSRADDADTPTGLIFIVVIAIVVLCSGSLFMALNARGGPAVQGVIFSVISVLLGWFVIHTMAALHYAYEYYVSDSAVPTNTTNDAVGGLDFPEGDAPDGAAFLYFAYVIGTAFAVSDVRVTSNKMRRIVLIHSTFTYFFNTVLLAATINVVLAMGGA
ncbi:DUF1345 domain-containing protein [Devosia algicola]|uniref:DUF1345 domain-containing protein n=1 Tax=Devosia algicola TaxID=3026418 RepID=A0ABY7YP61_9HYPH|nr:DUF1345 domain-containing protein [Devosia algicola]WDR03104.1 DUF1345 domain-containing protein [Devosia algicola]